MPILLLLLFILPLGIDTLGVSISLGMKSYSSVGREQKRAVPLWLRSALLFSFAETAMPVVGLIIGYAASLIVSDIMHYVGALLLIGLGLWELLEEGREYIHKRKQRDTQLPPHTTPIHSTKPERFQWGQQLLLALSISLDELAIGFSLGSITVGSASGKTVSPLLLCLLIGLQGFLMALIGLWLGRILRARLKAVKEWSELVSAFLLIGLGIWLLIT
jgi:putative Mn2+ efflux pump MntP